MNATEARDAVAEILSKAQVSFSATYAGETKRKDWNCDAWTIKIASGKATLETMYYTGLGLRKARQGAPADKGNRNTLYREQWERQWLKPVAPSAADVMRSLTLDAQASNESFPDWCSNYGYSDDSIDAFETYRSCCKIALDLRGIFKPETIAAMRDALQDY